MASQFRSRQERLHALLPLAEFASHRLDVRTLAHTLVYCRLNERRCRAAGIVLGPQDTVDALVQTLQSLVQLLELCRTHIPTPPEPDTLATFERALRIVAWAEHDCSETARTAVAAGALPQEAAAAQRAAGESGEAAASPAGAGSGMTSASSLPPPSKAWLGCMTFPYRLESLVWNAQHTRNTANCYCYCGKNKQTPCIQCRRCKQWFHTDCCKVLEGEEQNFLPFQRNYEYVCSVCGSGWEGFQLTAVTWLQAILGSFGHMMWLTHRDCFKVSEIADHIENNWAQLRVGKKKYDGWRTQLDSYFSNNRRLFTRPAKKMWGLADMPAMFPCVLPRPGLEPHPIKPLAPRKSRSLKARVDEEARNTMAAFLKAAEALDGEDEKEEYTGELVPYGSAAVVTGEPPRQCAIKGAAPARRPRPSAPGDRLSDLCSQNTSAEHPTTHTQSPAQEQSGCGCGCGCGEGRACQCASRAALKRKQQQLLGDATAELESPELPRKEHCLGSKSAHGA